MALYMGFRTILLKILVKPISNPIFWCPGGSGPVFGPFFGQKRSRTGFWTIFLVQNGSGPVFGPNFGQKRLRTGFWTIFLVQNGSGSVFGPFFGQKRLRNGFWTIFLVQNAPGPNKRVFFIWNDPKTRYCEVFNRFCRQKLKILSKKIEKIGNFDLDVVTSIFPSLRTGFLNEKPFSEKIENFKTRFVL